MPGGKHAKAPPALHAASEPSAPAVATATDIASAGSASPPAPISTPPEPAPAPRPAAAIPPPAPVATGSLDAVPSLGEIDVDGSLPDSEIRSSVERALGAFRDCYRSAARRAGKTPAFHIALWFVVDEGRAVHGVQIRDSNGDVLGVGACVKDAASKLRTRVAPDVGTATVHVVVKFQPTGG